MVAKSRVVDGNGRMARKLKTLMLRDDGLCRHCGGPVRIINDYYNTSPDRATADHTIPQSKGGTDRIDNLLLACYPCNNARGNGVIVRKKPYTTAAQYAARQGAVSQS